MPGYKRVIIDIHEDYAGILAVTAINQLQVGYKMQTNVSTTALDLSKGRHITIDSMGRFVQEETEA